MIVMCVGLLFILFWMCIVLRMNFERILFDVMIDEWFLVFCIYDFFDGDFLFFLFCFFCCCFGVY